MYLIPAHHLHSGNAAGCQISAPPRQAAPAEDHGGGGAVTQEFADSIGADAYTETAVDAAEKAKTFIV